MRDDDDDDDFERYGGPIAPGNLMTLLRSCLRPEFDHMIPHEVFDMQKMAREINGWLVLVGDTAADAATGVDATKQ